eukprot:4989972-Prymnesium_polylepis.1
MQRAGPRPATHPDRTHCRFPHEAYGSARLTVHRSAASEPTPAPNPNVHEWRGAGEGRCAGSAPAA